MHLDTTRKNLASAQWADPVEFAQQHRFEEARGQVWLGRSPIDGTPIGFSDNRHVCLVGGTRGGKGTSVILPNICSWPGSMVVIDPKGENATVAAARRGQGSDFCEGMGQDVHILDPFNAVVGQNAYKSHFNPLDALDPEHPEVIDRAAMIADALIVRDADSKEPYWQDSARAMIKTLILHVITWPHLERERNLITLRELLTLGDEDGVESLKEMGYEEIPSAYKLLWKTVSNNTALNKVISGQASIFSQMLANSPKEFGSILSTALINTEFVDSPGVRECLRRSDFELSDLKTKENGMSLFLSLPQRYMATHFRWLRMMVSLITAEMEIVRHQPRNGYPVMLMLDEFAGLERMKTIENAVAQIAGYGVKLFFVLQSLQQLKEAYKDGWETFLANTGIKIFFGIGDNFSRDYISKMLGETEVYRDVQTSSEGSGTTRSITEGTSEGESESQGESRSQGHTTNYTEGETYSENSGSSESRTTGESRGFSKSTGGSASQSSNQGRNESRNYGSNQGRSSSYGFGGGGSQFGSSSGASEGSSSGSSSGRSETRGQSWNKGFSINKNTSQTFGLTQSKSHGRSSSVARGESETIGTNTSRGITRSQSHSETTGESTNQNKGVNQVLHHRPLITPDEIGLCLSPLEDQSHPQYPGFALIVPSDGRPTAVRRCNYFEDGQFIGWYDGHPDHPQFAPPKFLQQAEILGLPDAGAGEYSDELITLIDKYTEDIGKAPIHWEKYPKASITLNQPLSCIGPIHFKKGIRHLRSAIRQVEHTDVHSSSDEQKIWVDIRAPQSGSLYWKISINGLTVGHVDTNRRIQHKERENTPRIPADSLYEYLNEVDCNVEKLKAEEQRKREESRRLKEEQKQKEEEEARRITLEKEAAEKRAAEAAEKERLRKEREAQIERERFERERIRAERRAAFKAMLLVLKAKTLKTLKYATLPVAIIGIIAAVWYSKVAEQGNYQADFGQLLAKADAELNLLEKSDLLGHKHIDRSGVLPSVFSESRRFSQLSSKEFEDELVRRATKNRQNMKEWIVNSLPKSLGSAASDTAPLLAFEYHVNRSLIALSSRYGYNLKGNDTTLLEMLPVLIISYNSSESSKGVEERTANQIIGKLIPLRIPSRGVNIDNIEGSKLDASLSKMLQLAESRLSQSQLEKWWLSIDKRVRSMHRPIRVAGNRNDYLERMFFNIDFFAQGQRAKNAKYQKENLDRLEASLSALNTTDGLIEACELIRDAIPNVKKQIVAGHDYLDASLALVTAFLEQEAMLIREGYNL